MGDLYTKAQGLGVAAQGLTALSKMEALGNLTPTRRLL